MSGEGGRDDVLADLLERDEELEQDHIEAEEDRLEEGADLDTGSVTRHRSEESSVGRRHGASAEDADSARDHRQ